LSIPVYDQADASISTAGLRKLLNIPSAAQLQEEVKNGALRSQMKKSMLKEQMKAIQVDFDKAFETNQKFNLFQASAVQPAQSQTAASGDK